MIRKELLLSLLAWVFCTGHPGHAAVEQIPIHVVNFNYTDYHGGIQNWGLDLSDRDNLYCGNSAGLLRFNGSQWTLLSDRMAMTVRAVMCQDDRIYTAGDNNIGYWSRNTTGNYEYVSLLPAIDSLGIKGETFWNIASWNGSVYFHSYGNIVRYDGSKVFSVVHNDHYRGLFSTGGRLFTQRRDGAVCQIRSDSLTCFSRVPYLQDRELKFLFQLQDGDFLAGLSDGSIGRLDSCEWQSIRRLETNNHLPIRVECGALYDDSLLAIGTIGHGVFLLDLTTNRLRNIESDRLQDLNVHALCFNGRRNLWLSLDNGISALHLDPEVYEWRSTAEVGIFFDGVQYGDAIYMATNRGLFRIRGDHAEEVPVGWYPLQLCKLKGELLCGSTTQLYKWNAVRHDFESLGDINGVRQFEYVADNGREYLFLRGYSGITVLQYRYGGWQWLSYILGTENYMQILPETLHTIWAIHSEKGIYRLRINPDLNGVESVDNFTDIDGWSDYDRISLLKLEGRICFFTPKGVYEYDPDMQTFHRKTAFSAGIQKLDHLQDACSTARNDLWVSTRDELYRYRVADNQVIPLRRYSFVTNPLLLYDRHFQFRQINDSLLFVSTCQGTVAINSRATTSTVPNGIRIESCSYWDGKQVMHTPVEGSEITLPSRARDIRIHISEGLSGLGNSFSYRIPALNDMWSDWNKSGIISLSMLPSGNYQVIVKDDNERSLEFQLYVEKPFYKQGWAIAAYIVIGILTSAIAGTCVVRNREKRFVERMRLAQQRHEEEMRRKTYEHLQEKVQDQERELKNNMRFLTQKQELLDAISSEVDRQKRELGERWPNRLYYRLVKMIQEGSTETDKLLSFENYFVEIHRDFMLRMQNAHNDLTQSELRLCCLIRSNLSTKEIAAIMGIAVRSVELKKYRLKKKLNIEREENLMSYIFSI